MVAKVDPDNKVRYRWKCYGGAKTEWLSKIKRNSTWRSIKRVQTEKIVIWEARDTFTFSLSFNEEYKGRIMCINKVSENSSSSQSGLRVTPYVTLKKSNMVWGWNFTSFSPYAPRPPSFFHNSEIRRSCLERRSRDTYNFISKPRRSFGNHAKDSS